MLLLLHYCPRLAKARQSLLESIRRCHCQYILYRHRQHLNLKGRNIHPIGKRLPRRITDVPNETQIQNPTLPNRRREKPYSTASKASPLPRRQPPAIASTRAEPRRVAPKPSLRKTCKTDSKTPI